MHLKQLLSHKTFSIFAYGVAAVVISFFIIGRYSPTLKPGDAAPIDSKLIALNGNQFTPKSLLSKKLLVVNFWATWCPPCQQELPLLSKMSTKYAANINFLGAIVESQKEDVLALKTRYALSYQLGFIDGISLSKWQAEILPTTYILDQKGKVLWAKNGVLREEVFEQALLNALASP